MKEVPVKIVEDVNDNKYNIESVIGQGGQGVVCRTTDNNLAVKFLLDKNGEIENSIAVYNEFETIINDVVIMQFESDIKLCKPEIMLKKPTSGYIMKLLSDLKPINELIFDMNSDEKLHPFLIRTQGLKKRLEVLLELARTLARIHSKGIVYCDISPNNVFYSDTTHFSHVWLIDCDNLKFSNDYKKGIFTPGYGAPEVVASITNNTIYSDAFSFAVLAFRVLTNKNPFEEDYSSTESTEDGWDVSITDPKQIKNNDVKWLIEDGLTKEQEKYFKHFIEEELLLLFDETFNQNGRLNPPSRPSMRRWYNTLKSVYTKIYQCQCGVYLYASSDECPFCSKEKEFSYFLSIRNIFNKENYEGVIDSTLSEFKDEDDEEFNVLLDITAAELKKRSFEDRYEHSIIVQNNLQIYNYNLFDVTINELPFPIIKFIISNNNLFVSNQHIEKIIVTTTKTTVLNPGDSVQIMTNNNVALITVKDPITKMYRQVRIFKYG